MYIFWMIYLPNHFPSKRRYLEWQKEEDFIKYGNYVLLFFRDGIGPSEQEGVWQASRKNLRRMTSFEMIQTSSSP